MTGMNGSFTASLKSEPIYVTPLKATPSTGASYRNSATVTTTGRAGCCRKHLLTEPAANRKVYRISIH